MSIDESQISGGGSEGIGRLIIWYQTDREGVSLVPVRLSDQFPIIFFFLLTLETLFLASVGENDAAQNCWPPRASTCPTLLLVGGS